MKKYLDIIYPIAIIILFAILLRGCGTDTIITEKPQPTRTVETKTDSSLSDTVFVEVIKLISKPGKIEYLPMPGNTCPELDTIKVYYDTTYVDSSLTIITTDSLRGMRLGLEIRSLYKPLTIKEVTTITDSIPYPYCIPKNEFYISGTINSNFALGIQGAFITKKGYMVNAGYNTDKEITLGVGIKLFK